MSTDDGKAPALKEMPPNAIPFMDKGAIWAFMVPQHHDDPEYADYGFSGDVYQVDGWTDATMMSPVPTSPEGMFTQIAVISLKWDGCAHVGLRDPELGCHWAHVCGADHMETVLRMLRWMWVEAQSRIPKYDRSIGGWMESRP